MVVINNNLITEYDFFRNIFNVIPRIFVPINPRKEFVDGKLIDVWDDEDIEATKELFKKMFNKKATEELSNLDWKVLRHKEQVELNVDTSITEAEYTSLLEQKQQIRNKVNSLEVLINECITVDDINNITW